MHAVFPQYPGLPRLDWTLKYNTGYWPFKMSAKPEGQTEEQFFKTLSYFDVANFTPDVQCPAVILVGLLDWVTASGKLGQRGGTSETWAGSINLRSMGWPRLGGDDVP